MLTPNLKKLKKFLDQNYTNYHQISYLESDPLQFLHRYQNPLDQEIVGFIASAFAYGNVKSINATVGSILSQMGVSPRKYIEGFNCQKESEWDGFIYRFNDQKDLVLLFYILKKILRSTGSLEDFFAAPLAQFPEFKTKDLIHQFSHRALEFAAMREDLFKRNDLRPGVRWFFTDPLAGGASKRINLFLRWMVRSDELDLGVWSQISQRDLMIPVDLHVSRISCFIGLTTKKQSTWRAAEEFTENLKRICPEDPTRYDFSLSRLGILKTCNGVKERRHCSECRLYSICIAK